MAEIIRMLVGTSKIERYLVGVADVEEEESLYELDTRRNGWVDSGPNAIALDAAYCDEALIRYELWDAEPIASDREEHWSGSVHLTSGKVFALNGISGDTGHYEEFDLGSRDRVWRFRVHREFLGHEDFPARIIRLALFKLQFWSPTDPVRATVEDVPDDL